LREDLYYRISTITINIPPLRERKEDIEPIAKYFIQKYSSAYEVSPIVMPDKYLDMLKAHSWPGNIRELQNTIESSLVMLSSDDNTPSSNLFLHPESETETSERPNDTPPDCGESSERHNLKSFLSSEERKKIIDALNKNAWNVSKTARAIGLSRSNLQYRMQKFGISSSDRSKRA
jgi:arginine utilization regulatory protein